MVITQPTVDDFSDTTVMRVIRKIVNYICSDSGLVAQINDNDITGFTSSYEDNVLKIDATKGDGSKLPVCNVTIEGGGSSTGNPYPTAVSGTVGGDGNITFNITMSSGSPLTTTINMNYFASTADLSDLQKRVTGLKLTSSGNNMSINGTTANIVNSVKGSVSGGNLTIGVNGVNSSPIEIGGGGAQWEELDVNSLPSDFATDDIIKVVAYTRPFTAKASDWNTTPTISHITVDKRNNNNIGEFMLANSNFGTSVVLACSATDRYVSMYYISVIKNISAWNSSNLEMFQLTFSSFNAGGSASEIISVNKTNISEYIKKMYRMRTN